MPASTQRVAVEADAGDACGPRTPAPSRRKRRRVLVDDGDRVAAGARGLRASVEPTRPQPMITKCTAATLHRRRQSAADATRAPERARAHAGARPSIVRRARATGRVSSGSSSAAPCAATGSARPCCPSASRCRSSPATRCPRWPTRPTRSSSSWRSPASRVLHLTWWVALAVVVRHAHRRRVLPAERARLPVAAAATTRSPPSTSAPTPGLTVASALLVDYVLTVAVSISSGVENVGVGARRSSARPRGAGRGRRSSSC